MAAEASMSSANANSTSTTPLRASCDRCRAQKLRCVPSSGTYGAAPCQRCLRLKDPKSCVFSRRSRIGRTSKSGSSDTTSNPSRKDKELPGTGTLSLFISPQNLPSTSELSTVEAQGPAAAVDGDGDTTTKRSPSTQQPEDTASANGNDVSTTDLDHFLDPGSPVADQFYSDMSLQQSLIGLDTDIITTPVDYTNSDAEESTSMSISPVKGDHSMDLFTSPIGQELWVVHPNDPFLTGMTMDLDFFAMDRPQPLVDLTALLAELSQYENQLAKQGSSTREFEDFPIGDALFLSQRFYAIITEADDSEHGSSSPKPSRLDMLLPVVTCYMTLTRIFRSVFSCLLEYLSQSMAISHPDHDLSHQLTPDMHAYRGLRLGQLRQTCMCASWDAAPRVRTAVSMLLSSFGGAESALGLPLDLRVVTGARGHYAKGKGAGARKTMDDRDRIFIEEGMMVELMNGLLYKPARDQARQLRGIVDELDAVLADLL
ncbi:Trichosetin biosynthesis cluster transcription factor TF22 [Paramyrothecium foliicola]|nr:Trichosetin biosynthesis cluster transcription factor TF22 [Paramyrothecium foliicola]